MEERTHGGMEPSMVRWDTQNYNQDRIVGGNDCGIAVKTPLGVPDRKPRRTYGDPRKCLLRA
jgi:hypothetical protein